MLPAMRKSVSCALPVRSPCCSFALRPAAVRPRSVRVADADKSSSTSTSGSSAEAKEDMPIWVRREAERKLQEQEGKGEPWGLYLLGSTLTAIAAVGCIFEFVDKNSFFGIIPPESPAWAPILLTLAVTGFPMAGFLFYKGVTAFNEDAERQDRVDGYSE